ncbi:uncharacterized protein A4U43_C04F31000 [Asparagus officinalis]|uniref:Uncharacterized protein n=1 Tax=Asparagus officinalis TaxID=4686 RepID=A0A5P1F9S2_ASPOF|nr:uncharacterized protein A4U43_C04F31000 [Asparagus officinalis]
MDRRRGRGGGGQGRTQRGDESVGVAVVEVEDVAEAKGGRRRRRRRKDEGREEPGEHPTPPRQVDINIQELIGSTIRQEVPDRGRGKGKRPLHVPLSLPSSKKLHLASPEPESVPRDSSRVREDTHVVRTQEPKVGSSGKEPILLDDEEIQVDYGHDDTDAYLTEPEDVGNFGDVSSSDDESDFGIAGEEIPPSLPPSGHFEPTTAFEGAFSILTSISKVEMIEVPVPSPALLVRRRLIIHGASDDDDDVLISAVPTWVEQEGPTSPEPSCDEGLIMTIAIPSEAEISSTGVKFVPTDVLTTTAMVVAELQDEMERLSDIRSRAIPINPRVLREKAQKGGHEVRDA